MASDKCRAQNTLAYTKTFHNIYILHIHADYSLIQDRIHTEKKTNSTCCWFCVRAHPLSRYPLHRMQLFALMLCFAQRTRCFMNGAHGKLLLVLLTLCLRAFLLCNIFIMQLFVLMLCFAQRTRCYMNDVHVKLFLVANSVLACIFIMRFLLRCC